MRWRIASVATAPNGHLYIMIELLDDVGQVIRLEDVLLAVDRSPQISTNVAGLWLRADGSAVEPWVLDDDGEWQRPAEDPQNHWVTASTVREQVVEVVRSLAGRWVGRTGDGRDRRLAAECMVRGDEPSLIGYEEVI